MSIDATQLRVDYDDGELLESKASDNPFIQFKRWFEAAQDAEILEPNAMVLATVNHEGHPDARVVLLKETDDEGFIFYTNYESTKGDQLSKNPYVSAVFNWLEHQRQVRICGKVEKISQDKSEAYFHSRPKASQIGALVSNQSEEIADRTILEDKKSELDEKFAKESVVPYPSYWGGYRIIPTSIEFWQGRRSRLHDRLLYRKKGELHDTRWERVRLAP